MNDSVQSQVSAQAGGLLPISQTSLFPYVTLSYHDYEGVAFIEAEKPRLVQTWVATMPLSCATTLC